MIEFELLQDFYNSLHSFAEKVHEILKKAIVDENKKRKENK